MKLGDFLNSINWDKNNVIRDSASMKAAEKFYPHFPVARSLSYHADSLLLVNELNTRGLSEHGLSSLMQYEFLLHCLPRKKRFSKWSKPTNDDKVDVIMQIYKYSYDKAQSVADIISDEDYEVLSRMLQTGGKE